METKENSIEYRVEHLGTLYGQDDYELGAYVNNEIIGLIEYVIFEEIITIKNILVRPEYRRKGFGSKMIQYLKQNHPEATYKPSIKTDLGVKFKHKHHDNIFI